MKSSQVNVYLLKIKFSLYFCLYLAKEDETANEHSTSSKRNLDAAISIYL